MKQVLFVTSEATPFAASGGLGDVMGALPRAVRRLGRGSWQVSVLLPLYGTVDGALRRRMKKVAEGELSLAWRRVPYAVHRLTYYGCDYLFIENARYFDRPNLYGEYDDGERFAFFSRAVLEYARSLPTPPDILHANDWQSALSIIYLRTLFATDERLASVRTVYTVHNIEYQGCYDPAILSDVLDLHPVHAPHVLHRGAINLARGAIALADRITTVSPRYAAELCRGEHDFGLGEELRRASWKLRGILNGLDTAYFSPKDKSLPHPFSLATLEEGKAANKAAVLREVGLKEDGSPLLLMISRLVAAKGLDLLLSVLPGALAEGASCVILGTGDPAYEAALRRLAEAYPERLRVIVAFDRALSKRLYAGADLFLMPSRSEPCGLSQMVACRYGCIPIVHAVGGLADSITPYAPGLGNGFSFEEYSEAALREALSLALSVYRDTPAELRALRRRCMQSDFSWRPSALKYLELYESITTVR